MSDSDMSLEDCVAKAFALVPDDAAVRFAQDPIGFLRTELGLKVTAVDHLADSRTDGGACDGVSFLEDQVVLFAPTPNSRRQNFTLAHEYGHWLAENAPHVYDWLANQDDPGRLLETVCDRLAQRLLLPDNITDAVIGTSQIQAQHLFELYATTQASRPVCAIALAKRLPGLGAVAIVDRYAGVVTHSSVNPDPHRGWPTVFPWRNQQLAEAHPLLRLPAGSSSSRRMMWSTPWNTQAEYYVDATGDGRRVIAVFSDTDLWGVENFHPGIDRDFDIRPLLSGHCCGSAFERRGYPCDACGRPFCPRCRECRCERDATRELMCRVCGLVYQPQLVLDGVCVDCRS